MRDLETRNYKLGVGSGAGKGTFIIIRTLDDYSTLLFTGGEALSAFRQFEHAFNISDATFDNLCAKEAFTA